MQQVTNMYHPEYNIHHPESYEIKGPYKRKSSVYSVAPRIVFRFDGS